MQSEKLEGLCSRHQSSLSSSLGRSTLPQEAVRAAAFFLCLWFFFAAGASQVKWNKKNANYLATSHDGDVRIWDKRVSGLFPVTSLP